MQIDVYSAYNQVSERMLRDRSIVVIDVLRATTTILQALQNGAQKIIPVAEIEEAIAFSKSLDAKNVVLAGERSAAPIAGFACGNSPLEFTSERVKNKTVVLTTTNGTRALNHVKTHQDVIIASLRNKTAVAKLLIEKNLNVSIICAGTNEDFSADDVYCAGGIIHAIRGLLGSGNLTLSINDMALVAEHFFPLCKQNPAIISQASHYNTLMQSGYAQDIEFCFQEDQCTLVPLYSDGTIKS